MARLDNIVRVADDVRAKGGEGTSENRGNLRDSDLRRDAWGGHAWNDEQRASCQDRSRCSRLGNHQGSHPRPFPCSSSRENHHPDGIGTLHADLLHASVSFLVRIEFLPGFPRDMQWLVLGVWVKL